MKSNVENEVESTKKIECAEKIKVEENVKHDFNIDLIRIVACLSVILTHIALQIYNVHIPGVDWSRLFEKSYFTDGVPLFFLITGFFIANGRNYKKIWKSAIFKVFIPAFIYAVTAQIFVMYILGKKTFSWCLQYAWVNKNLLGILRSVLTGNLESINSLCEHLWYILSYGKILLWIPILWLICKNEKNSNFARRMILGFGFVSLLLQDIQRFVTIPWIGNFNLFEYVDKEILYVLFGYELFLNKDKFKKIKNVSIISLGIFILINIIRYKLEMTYMVLNSFTDISGRDSFMEWRYTSINIISSLALFIFLYSINLKNEKFNKILKYIASYTFGIYLIHYMLIAKVDLFKFEIYGKLWQEIIYLAVALLVTFMISLIIMIVLRKIKELFKKLFCLIIKK